jgi:hypothetical protein
MIKELKIFFYLIIIFIFFFLVLKFYFSNDNRKNSYRSLKQIDEKIITYSQNLFLLKNDTKNIVEYIEKNINKNKKNYNFWKLLNNDK